jgi:hypothetical protein
MLHAGIYGTGPTARERRLRKRARLVSPESYLQMQIARPRIINVGLLYRSKEIATAVKANVYRQSLVRFLSLYFLQIIHH